MMSLRSCLKMQPTTAKIVWGYSRLVPYLIRVVYTSRFIPTEDKDGLIKAIKDLLMKLKDMVDREQGRVPFPPSTMRDIDKKRKKVNDS